MTGAFQGLTVVIAQVQPARQRVAVLLDFLGRQNTLVLPEDAVLKPGSERASLL
jgi:transcription antitermination factor NusG